MFNSPALKIPCNWRFYLVLFIAFLFVTNTVGISQARPRGKTRTTTTTTTTTISPSTSTIATTTAATTSTPTNSSTTSTTTRPSSTSPLPFGQAQNSGWTKIIFQDEFEGDTSKWQRNWRMGDDNRISPPANKSYEAACWDPKNTYTANGNLIMKAEKRVCTDAFGTSYEYATGGMSSGNFNFTYGYAEARIFLPSDINNKIANFPAFWLNGTINDSGVWPAGGEIDIVEGLSDNLNNWHYHWGTRSTPYSAGGTPSVSLVPTLINPAGWHTYGVDWSQNSIKIYYDGILVATITTGVVSTPMYIAFDNAVPSRWTPTVPANMQVDYVRVWQR